eukprot:gene26951-27178_t
MTAHTKVAPAFFGADLAKADPDIAKAIDFELTRQR